MVLFRYYFALIGIVIFIFSGCSSETPLPERDIRPFDWKEVYTLPNEELDIPIIPRMIYNKYGLWVHDKSNEIIHLIDIRKNKIIASYGGKGRGPGEAEFLFDFAADNGRLITVDTKLLRLTHFDIDTGDVLRTSITKTNIPSHISIFDNYYLIVSGASDSLLYLHDINTDSLLGSSSILDLDMKQQYALSVPGFITPLTNTSIAFIPAWDHRIFEFNIQNHSMHRSMVYKSDIDTFTFKPSNDISQTSQTMLQAPRSPISRSSVARTNTHLLLPYREAGNHPTQRFVAYLDVMDLDLNYLYSFGDFYPNELTKISAYEEIFCRLHSQSSISCYEIPEHLR